MVNSLITTNGKKVLLYRAYTETGDLSATQYLPPSQFQVGISNATITAADTSLTIPIPIANGTVNDDGSNTFTGSSGGDNSTDNTTTYKVGAGAIDDTAQNLIANDTSVSKIWTISNLAAAGTVMTATQPFGFWLDIKDATALAKFVSSGTALDVRFRTNGDAADKYYQYVRTAAQLEVGWNWITSNLVLVNALTQGAGGAPSGVLNEFVIIITTNNATDEFIAGDIIYDLLRGWAASDLVADMQTGYPSLNLSLLEVTTRCYLTTVQANGFLLDSVGIFNKDTSKLLTSADKYDSVSKSSTDELAFVAVDRII